MKILFSITYYSPYVSGLTMYVKRLAGELVKKNYDITVLCMQHDKNLPAEEENNGVKIIRAKTIANISKGFISIDFLVQAWNLVQNTDVVMINLPQFEGIVVALLAKLFSKKLIVIYHCEVILPPGFFNSIVQSLLEISNFLSLLLADQVVTYTPDFANHSKLLSRVKDKLVFTYPPVPQPVIKKNVITKLKLKFGKADYFIGVAARLATEKGIEYLLGALSAVQSKARKSKVIIAGPLEPVGEANYKNKILKLVEKYKDEIVFLGTLPEEEMGAFYSLLDVLVLPSINSTEAFGMVQVEAMLCGVPVVVSDLPGVRIPVTKTGMGIVVPLKNSQAIAEAIVEIIKNKSKFVKPKTLIEKEFAIKKTVEFFENIF